MSENARELNRAGQDERVSGHWIVKIWLTDEEICAGDGCVVFVIDPSTQMVAHADGFLARNDQELGRGVVAAIRKAEEKKIVVGVDNLRAGRGGSR